MTPNKIADEMHNIVFVGVRKNIAGNRSIVNVQGTGFIVRGKDGQYIITCAHVHQHLPVFDSGSIFCGVLSPDTKDSQEQRYDFIDIELVKKHPDDRRDVCAFAFKKTPATIKDYGYDKSILASEEDMQALRVFEGIDFAGYPLANELMQMGMGITMAASKGVISAIKYSGLDKRIDFILIDRLVNPGNSGSPVFHGNKIIGVASGTLNQTTRVGESVINIPANIGMVRPSNYILELMNDIEGKS